ncbi:MAG: glycosyltransferase family 117 protein [Bacteroidales bacterium]
MLNYKKLNLIFGWAVFAVATVVYMLTIEPTVSFWDCGEFIACGNKLLVGHPPGAPLFLMIARLFAMLNPTNPAVMVNTMSALCSSFTILFLFWTITHLMAKLYPAKDDSNYGFFEKIMILGSATVGALAYTFSDTFWFSAVEGEVYAMSSLFTAVVFWAILKWENEANESFSNRWLIVIAYLMGLSIGVHLLNLLAIPAMVMVYYFKKYPVTTKGIIYASGAAVLILGATLYGIIPWTFIVGSWFELLFVNSFGLPYNSGLLFFSCALFAGLAYGIYRTHQKGKALLNTILLCTTVILLGYASYTMVLVRSSANPSMDQNNPDNVFNLMSYLNRDQYGDRPLIKGQYFNAPAPSGDEGDNVYAALNGRYEVVDKKTKYVYDSRFTTLFPRMFSNSNEHANFYKTWNGGFKGKPVRIKNDKGEAEIINIPTFAENLSFFFTYQLGYMYFRYFMWNFAGRQNDQQGHGEITNGNWISGIPFMDNMRLGNQSQLPDTMKNNKARNKYYLLPFLLGLTGLLFQYGRNKKDFTVVMLLFFFTGIAIVMYLNQSPIQPRERDYAYAGSFYAFCIWIGIGVAGLAEGIRRMLSNKILAASVATIASFLAVPCLMASENWDDHDRSNRYLASDFAYNYLQSCKPNSVLFTYGDNDTFPLWYAQEVENVRTDVRIMNLSYSSAEWYIEQMQQAYYQSAPLPMSLTTNKIAGSRRAIVFVEDRVGGALDIKKAMDFVISDEPNTKMRSQYREALSYFPSKTLRLETNVENAKQAQIISGDETNLLPHIDIPLNSRYVYRNTLSIFDLLANFNWTRPVQWGITVPNSYNLGIDKHFKNEGFANLLVPQNRLSNDGYGTWTNADSVYNRLMNVYRFRNLNNDKVYYDETCTRMLATIRNVFTRTIFALINENKKEQAKTLINKYLETFPLPRLSYYYSASSIVEALYAIDDNERANELSDALAKDAQQHIVYYTSEPKIRQQTEQDLNFARQSISALLQSARRNKQPEQEKKLSDMLTMFR